MGCCESTPARFSQPQAQEGQIRQPEGVIQAHREISKYGLCESAFPHCPSRLANMVRKRARRGSIAADYDDNSALYDSDIPLSIRHKVASLEADERRRLGDEQWALRNLLARHLWKQEQARNAVELKVAEATGQFRRYPIPLPLPPIPLTSSSSSSQDVSGSSTNMHISPSPSAIPSPLPLPLPLPPIPLTASSSSSQKVIGSSTNTLASLSPSTLTDEVRKHGLAKVKTTHQASNSLECPIVEKHMEEAAAPKQTSNMQDTSVTARGRGIGPIIYVENLPANISACQLEKEFKKFGNIKSGKIQQTNEGPGGSAFILFESRDSVLKAIQGSPLLISNKLVFVRV